MITENICYKLLRRINRSTSYADTLDDHFAAEQLEEHFGVEELQQPIDFETQDPETAKGTKVKHFGVEE